MEHIPLTFFKVGSKWSSFIYYYPLTEHINA